MRCMQTMFQIKDSCFSCNLNGWAREMEAEDQREQNIKHGDRKYKLVSNMENLLVN